MVVRSQYSARLVERIAALRDGITLDLANGSAAEYPDYRQQVGRIQGLNDALNISDDIDREISGE